MKKNRYKILLFISIFGLIGFLVSLSSSNLFQILFYLAMCVVFLILYFKLEKSPEVNTKQPSSRHASTPNISVSEPDDLERIDISGFVFNNISSNSGVVSSTPRSPYKHETHHIAGTSFRQSEIKSLGYENPYYDSSKKELIEDMRVDEKIYKYEFSPSRVELIEEPDNPHDPNAIKVVIDGVHVGYIKSGSCTHVRKLIHSGKIKKISADIHGGPYKMLYSEIDEDTYDDVYDIEKDKTDYFVSIELIIGES